MAIKISYKNSSLEKNLDNMAEKLGAVVLLYAATKAKKIEGEMKSKRPWRDRTGAAKARLQTSVSQPQQDVVRITLMHGVDYGINLELAHEKKYAIIAPTVKVEGPKVITDLNNIMSKIRL